MTANRSHGEPRLASVASWAVLAASFGLSATTWVALAQLAGFTSTLQAGSVTLRLAWLMPVAVDGYVVVALVLWMSPVPPRVAAFAKRNTYGAAGIGIAAQSAYHLLHTASTTNQEWRVVLAAIVGALPPAVAALAVHMRALIRREGTTGPAQTLTVPATDAASAGPAPTPPPSTMDLTPATRPAPTADTPPAPRPAAAPAADPDPAGDRAPVPNPATVAARTDPQHTTTPARPAPAPERRRPAPRPRPSNPTTPATTLAPSATDHHVTAPDAAQLTLPVVAPDLLARATRIARQYRTEHGTPITAGQLAVRLKVESDTAAQALAVLDLAPDNPTRPAPTVNGNRPRAVR